MLTHLKRLDRCGTIRNQTSRCTLHPVLRAEFGGGNPFACIDWANSARETSFKEWRTGGVAPGQWPVLLRGKVAAASIGAKYRASLCRWADRAAVFLHRCDKFVVTNGFGR
jgi:hypothetical protein